MTTNAVWSNEVVDFSLLELGTFTRILQTIQDVHEGDYSTFKFLVDLPFVKFESKKFKTKIGNALVEIGNPIDAQGDSTTSTISSRLRSLHAMKMSYLNGFQRSLKLN